MEINGERVSDKNVISNAFKDYFSSIGEKKTASEVTPTETNLSNFLPPRSDRSIFFHLTHSLEIIEILDGFVGKTVFQEDF